jgi:hypothetical protein
MDSATLQFILTAIAALCAAIRGNFSPCGESLQAQIHPLGERRRGNTWGVTVGAFTVGSVLAGGTLAAMTAALGSFATIAPAIGLTITAVLVLLAGLLDLVGVRPWGPRRQVNENWIGRYRGWVYGIGFGLQLGLGFSVFVMSWGYYAMLAGAFISGSPMAGFLAGAIFGVARGVMLFLAVWIDSPERLNTFHRRMSLAKGPALTVTAVMMTAVGALGLL